jgi:hypothetical protein
MKKFAKKLNIFYPECPEDALYDGQIVDYTYTMLALNKRIRISLVMNFARVTITGR